MEFLTKIYEKIDGKKMYISSIMTGIYGVIKVFKLIDTTPEQDMAIFTLLGAIMGISIKSAMTKLEK